MDNKPKEVRGARYIEVDDTYLEKRQLRKSAGWVLLWGLGVGAVISGDFFGWNFGLAAGGFGGLLLATLVVAVLYVTMVLSIAELSTALPHAGGFYSFTRSAFGPNWAFLNGVTDLIEYVITPAVIVVGIAGYMNALIPGVPSWVWWAVFYTVFVGINIRGTALTLRVSLIVTLLALGVLVVFYLAAAFSGAFSWDKVFNIEPQPGGSSFLPMGWYGVFAALPFAIWFYLAIEQLPLAAEEAHDVVRDMPRALILGIATLLVLSVLTLILNTGVAGAKEVGASGAPLELGFKAVFGDAATSTILTLIAITGLVASFHAIIYAYGRLIFALSRAGYLPTGLSVVSQYHTPHYALTLGAVVGFLLCVLISVFSESVGAALLNMAVFGAVISYAMVMFAYIRLAHSRPDLPRPYRSPLGVPGAWVGAILALVCLAATFAVESYRPGVVGTAVFVVLMMAYYWFYSRFRLVAKAPEEEAALIAEAQREIR
ncbi:ethanolamine permease [Meiothermus rufus]|uniref:ethanolamine permease n=1 Tax=Meiothermus rufus TaxID=604332 RepID=UPI0004227549|nr:ethanolamine permease [Meiothermus rufus]